MKTLTIMQVLPELHSGGVERGTLEIAQALVTAGHRSIVISAGGRLVRQLESEGSEHLALPVHRKSLRALWQVYKLRKVFIEIKPDIVHVRSRLPAWLCKLAIKTLPRHQRPKVVSTVHGLYSVNGYSKVMAQADAVVAVSKTVTAYIQENYPDCFGPHCELIYRGIDPASFPWGFQPSDSWLQTWNSQFPALAGKTLLCLPGRITRLKGHREFVQLIDRLQRAGRDVIGLIVGDPDPRRLGYFQEIKALVSSLELDSAIVFVGHRADIREIYAISNIIFSLSTKPESFGRTVLEPLAMGRPVIGYDHGGVGEILSALFPQGKVPRLDDAALFEKTQTLLSTPQTPNPENPFLLAAMKQQTLDLYQRLASAD
ncbi:glycosyltransferase family 4 protein [Simiduia aestuariiviva]|uniref:Glycosyltransferase involved in cell wall biosynthesis n=1 Tax=Simiduia aestuariiviva TaxID=1510459 RepID=A0A839UWQ2_9GAMM|nr:glycosyltransferase family 4 protein [Simiduia aestuariiviva]MBB3169888.1 glycosyltransferase involved in cell wall biosynthesis [Simiduia aestuariiviva]